MHTWARQRRSCRYREKEEGYGTDKRKTTFWHVCTWYCFLYLHVCYNMVVLSPSLCFYQVFSSPTLTVSWRISSLFLFRNKDNCRISKKSVHKRRCRRLRSAWINSYTQRFNPVLDMKPDVFGFCVILFSLEHIDSCSQSVSLGCMPCENEQQHCLISLWGQICCKAIKTTTQKASWNNIFSF